MSNGLPASKIIMGNALYGRGFTLANPNNNGILAQVSGPIPGGPFSRKNGTWAYYEVSTRSFLNMNVNSCSIFIYLFEQSESTSYH